MDTPSIQRRNAIPVLYTRGTYYQVGFDVGRTFRGLIQDFVSSYKILQENLLPAYHNPEGRKAYDKTLAVLERNFPHYIKEIRGTSDGAKVPFLHLMLLHMDDIVPNAIGQECPGTFGCSSFFCFNEKSVVLGHTEDALLEVLNHIYIVNAIIDVDEPQGRWQTKRESFTALCYAGHIPGFCMGYNHHGLVYSMNVIFPKTLTAGKTPRHILSRALLSAETMDRAIDILRDKGVGSADGFSVNLNFTNQKGENFFKNIEVGPASASEDESHMSIVTVPSGGSSVHTNKYLRLNIPEMNDMNRMSCQSREAIASKYSPITSKDDIIALVSNVEDQEFPVFRDGKQKDFVTTVTVGIFDLLEKTWTFWMNQPATSKPILVHQLKFKWDA